MSYGPPLWRAFAFFAVAVLAAVGAVFVPELWAFAAVLAVGGARDTFSRPALRLEPDGFHYVVGLHKEFAEWDLVDAIRVREERHFLAFGRVLEIDLSDDTLIVLSKLQLGVSPDAVVTSVEAAWRSAVPR
jgi:hypothetical protein